MAKSRIRLLDFVIDKLTNSIENVLTSEVFDTEIVRLTDKELKLIVTKDWQFNWRKEIRDKRSLQTKHSQQFYYYSRVSQY